MADLTTGAGVLKALLPLTAALALASCGGADDAEKTYEVGATDESGGDLIVEDADQKGVEVELPDTAMTAVPDESPAPEAATPAPAE